MTLNGTELIEDPFNTIFSPYTDLIGSIFWLIPLSFIAMALFIRTKNVTVVGLFLIGSGVLLSGGGMFTGATDMALIYSLVAVLGVIVVVAQMIMPNKYGGI